MAGHAPGVWIGFTVLVAALLVLDLGWLNRRPHAPGIREATIWSVGIVALALLFGGFLLAMEGPRSALEYYTGYLIELSLSVDNLFVFILVFQYFAVPPRLQPRVLHWGILGAMLMRGAMIVAGAFLITRFEWITWVFGAILIVTGIRMFVADDANIRPERNPIVLLARRYLPLTKSFGRRAAFFVRAGGGRVATPLFLVLLVVEWSDLVFAIDSIPAIFAITRDPFIVYSSNVFAILGLRALFFVLADALDRFRFLKPGVALILVFVGTKMALSHWVQISTVISLCVVVATLATAVVGSILLPPRAKTIGD